MTDDNVSLRELAFDADLATKEAWSTEAVPGPPRLAVDRDPAPGDPVNFPGDAVANASGSRAPTPGSHNWVSIGPRNVGGRVTALAVDPTNAAIMYAGGASGGVFKSLDGGQSWFPLWQDTAALAVGAIDISPSAPQTIWVATGEVSTGGAEIIRGDGVYVSTDGGATWATSGPPGAAPSIGFSFDACAAHPTDPTICWAVGPAGVFRTFNGGGAWTQFAATAGTNFSDVAFSTDTAGRPILYLVRGSATSAAGGSLVIRLDNALHGDPATTAASNDAAVEAALALAANQMQVVAPPGGPNPPLPGRAKIAIAPSNRNVAYVLYADATSGAVLGLYRSRNARATPPSSVAWTRLAPHVDWPNEAQGGYNISLAVSPANSNHVALGFVELYTSTNANTANAANVNWNLAMLSDLYHLDRAHHADHHAALFIQRAPGTPELWVGNDGGISMSTDWNTANSYVARGTNPSTILPLPAGGTTWQKRSAGLLAAQMYDLTTSPLVPTMMACGFQDNGVYVTDGGPTWRLALSADGGFVTFDPDDPYRFLATWQGAIDAVEFAGALDGTFPVAGHDVVNGLWPRELTQGFLPEDDAVFVADTASDPFDSDRVLNARWHRLYGLQRGATGELWAPEAVGTHVHIFAPQVGGNAQITVQQSAGARGLGLEPQRSTANGASAHLLVPWTEPYAFAEGDVLQLNVNGAALPIVFRSGPTIASAASATAAEVIATINAQAGGAVTAAPTFPARPLAVEIQTIATSPAAPAAPVSITLGGTALTTAPASRLGIAAGTYTALPGAPAIVRIPVVSAGAGGSAFANAGGPPANMTLTVQVSGRPMRTVTFSAPTFANPTNLRVGELVAALRTALSTDGVRVEPTAVFKSIRLRGNPPGGVTIGGTALAALGLTAGGFLGQSLGNEPYNVPPGQTLQLTVGATTATVTFNAATFQNLGAIYVDELLPIIQQAITTAGLAGAFADLNVGAANWTQNGLAAFGGHATEITFSPVRPNTVWVGAMAGTIFASDDGGQTWRTIRWPAMVSQDRRVEAIAFHPTEPDTVYVGLYGERQDLGVAFNNPLFLGTGANDPGFMFRSTDGGATFTHIGAQIVDTGAPPSLVSINAIETDPAQPDAVYVGTNIGVFASTDRGRNWTAMNQGLPNAWIRDLAFEPTTRMLRAGAWGRGVYERHVGTLPAQDVQLYVRANELDMGVQRPAPIGPSVMSPVPARAEMSSPDIKITRSAPARLLAAGAVIDGVDFDEDIVDEHPTPGAADLFVQVHNRGAFPASGVRVVTMYADTSAGVPPLPELFWVDHLLGPVAGAQGAWTVLDDHTMTDPTNVGADRVTPEMPRVRHVSVNFPADIANFASIGILTIVESPQDTIPADVVDVTDVERLVATQLKIALRQSLTTPTADDHQLFLRGVDGAQFSVAASPTASALQRLGWAAAVGPVSETLAGSETFDLRPPGPTDRGIRISTPQAAFNISIPTNPVDFPPPGPHNAWAIASALNREFAEAGLGIQADAVLTPPPGPITTVRIRGFGGTQFAITGGSLQLLVGFPVTPPGTMVNNSIGTNNQNYVIPPGNNTLTMLVAQQRDVRFANADFGNRRLATAREVRNVINRAMAESRMPVRAEVPRVALRVGGSVTDVLGPEPTLGGAHLAELTAQGNVSIPPAGRAALFQLLPVLGADTVQRNANKFLYLRVTNAGNVQAAAAQTRLFAVTIDPGDGEVTTAQIGADVPLDVPAGGFGIAEFQWNPGPVDAGSEVYVLAVANQAGREIAIPPTFTDFDAFHEFCVTNPAVAYRSFGVSP
ncbi:MAG: hypothetical protein QNJ12_07140 [Ilumatobacter sp.]|uniref:WD40/YVTN/BNR-like repeat-containing protein n=1 Tax=Ilumatobacter sp. TaxID=1967498 RepID=UPI0026371463|nr:hypothetical protein [Ilumatobacter sp.]MDJ0768552.1 hypothetical protein [Ilumatobacter sp.]